MQAFSCEFWEIFKSTCFKEHLRETAFTKILAKLPFKFLNEILDV